MARVVFIWLPWWPIERFCKANPGAPPELALSAPKAGAERLMAVSPAAARAGLHAGLTVAEARVLDPELAIAPYDQPADDLALYRLARWASRFSPRVTPLAGDPQNYGLYLSSAGVAHLFGGEAGLMGEIAGRFQALGLTIRAALADTPGAAFALARFDRRAKAGLVVSPGAGLSALAHLPAAALRLAPGIAEKLRAVGLKRIGELAAQPRAGLARRFGAGLTTRLDQAAGRMGEALAPLEPEPVLRVVRRLAEPLTTLSGLEEIIADLTADLAPLLAREGVAARRLQLTLFRVDGRAARIALAPAAPAAEALWMARLFRERLARLEGRLDIGFGLDAAALSALAVEKAVSQPVPLDPAARAAAAAQAGAAELADRLAARLGAERVETLSPRAVWAPERAQASGPIGAGAAFAPPPRARPILLFTPPEPVEALAEAPDGAPRRFRWRRVAHHVARASGPERLGAEWWLKDGPARDYYRLETREGVRLWVFREGAFGEAPAPQWFVHGAFP